MNTPSRLVRSAVKILKSAVTPRKPRAGLESHREKAVVEIACTLPNCTSSACSHSPSPVPAYTLPAALNSDPYTLAALDSDPFFYSSLLLDETPIFDITTSLDEDISICIPHIELDSLVDVTFSELMEEDLKEEDLDQDDWMTDDSVIPACGLGEEMLTSVVLDFADFDLSVEFPDVIKKEVVAPVVAATAMATSSLVTRTSPTTTATVVQTSRALVAPTKAKVSLATRVSLAPPATRPRAKVSASAAVATAARPVVPKVTPAQIVVEAASKSKVSLATRVSLAPPTSRPRAKAAAVAAAPAVTTTGIRNSRAVVTPTAPRPAAPKVSLAARVSLAPPTTRPRSALAPAVAPAQSRVRPASQARSDTLQAAVAAPQKPKVSLANRVSLAPRARGAGRVLPKNMVVFG